MRVSRFSSKIAGGAKAYRPANYLVLLLNFLHETGCDGTGCGVGAIANDDALEFVSALGRGHAGQATASPPRAGPLQIGESLHAARPVWKGKTAPGPACASWGERAHPFVRTGEPQWIKLERP